MKINVEQIKNIIKEELKSFFYESIGASNVRIYNIEEAEPGEENILPLQYGTDLITCYSLKLSEVLSEYFQMDQETYDLVLNKIPKGDNVEQLFDESDQAASSVEMLMSLDEKFVGYPTGTLKLTDSSSENTNVKMRFNGVGIDIVNSEEVQKMLGESDGQITIKLGLGLPSPNYIGGIIAREVKGRGEDAKVTNEDKGYVSYFDPGVSSGFQEYPAEAYIRLNKVLDDIKSGTLVIKIEQKIEGDPDSIHYKVLV